ncbi:MAG TPA: glycosyltransferase family 39 protein [Saprospiraceae bacterium]|nr:glycosyltransferase family 39 protein [Saprospiraceae bacterium]HMQ81934.1 glycosyltransferase family 39 protein [Saprospiraceae bacterium]
MSKSNFDNRTLAYIFLIAVWVPPLFLHLDSHALQIYDEARRGVNAMEMYLHGFGLVSRYEGQADMWGTKPPLLIWIQTGLMHLLGTGVLALRLPSALAGFFTALCLVLFSKKIIGNYLLGVIASILFVTSQGVLQPAHSLRTGDFDALLLFFIFSYVCSYFLFLQSKSKKWLYLSALGIFLAVMTKGVAGLLMLPGLACYTLLSKNGKAVLLSRHFYVSALWCIGGIILFYWLREQYNPGYLKAVWENELGGRFTQTLEGNKGDFGFYWSWLLGSRFGIYFVLAIVGILHGAMRLFKKTETEGIGLAIHHYFSINALLYLLVISCSATKLPWYDLPVYPMLAWLAASGLLRLSRLLPQEKWGLPAGSRTVLVVLFLAGVYVQALVYCFKPIASKFSGVEAYGYYIPEVAREHQVFNISALYYRPDARFYSMHYNSRGYEVWPIDPNSTLSVGTKVLICTDYEKQKIAVKHTWAVLDQKGDCLLVEIK